LRFGDLGDLRFDLGLGDSVIDLVGTLGCSLHLGANHQINHSINRQITQSNHQITQSNHQITQSHNSITQSPTHQIINMNGRYRTRTCDSRRVKPVLYQLS
jgi:hypothetical protein